MHYDWGLRAVKVSRRRRGLTVLAMVAGMRVVACRAKFVVVSGHFVCLLRPCRLA